MKPPIVRFLTVASFFIFMLPFVQMCSTNLHRVAVEPENTKDIVIEKKDSVEDTYHSFFYTEKSSNAYELGKIIFIGELPKLKELNVVLFYMCYTIIIILSIIMTVNAFKSRYKKVYRLALANIALLLLSTIMHYSIGMLEYWWQIKYGYYVFLINMVCVILVSKSITKQTNNRINN